MRLSLSKKYADGFTKLLVRGTSTLLMSSVFLISTSSAATVVIPTHNVTPDASINNKSTKDSPQRSVIPGAENDTISLGTAYHSTKQGFYGLQSVNGTTDETHGNTRAEVRIGVDLGYKEILDMVSGNVEASLNIPAVRVDAGATYAKESAADEYTGSYTVYVAVKPKKRALVPNTDTGYQPTTAATELVDTYPGDKYEQVGDEFVTAIEYASFLIVNLKIEFKNSKDKRDIGGHLGVDWVGKVKVGGELKLIDEDIKKTVKISVSALQSGGDVTQLTQIIPDGLMQCSLDNPDPCFQLFEDAVVYLKSNYINQFDTLDKYNAVKLYTRRYDESGPALMNLVPDDYEEISFPSKLAHKNMSEKWISSLLHMRRAENILTYYSAFLSDDQKTAINEVADNSRFNAFIYADSVAFCNRNPFGDYCFDTQQQTEQNIKPYDQSVLNITTE